MALLRALQAFAFGFLGLLILYKPYLGVVFTAATLPILEVLPPIPFATSAVMLIGGITFGAYLFWTRWIMHEQPRFPVGLRWGVFFWVWMIISHPSAALFPDLKGRLWGLTFLQLLLLAWIAEALLNTPWRHRVLMWAFFISAVVSAFFAAREAVIGPSLEASIRAVGLVGGQNTAARYFVVALIFLSYLWIYVKKPWHQYLLILSAGLLIYGVISTISRTGIFLLIAALGMLFLERIKEGRRRAQAFVLLVVALIVVWVFAENVINILQAVFPAIREGTGTVGLRYALWKAALRMWLDHPIMGVGIGQYSAILPTYGWDLLPMRIWHHGAHNMYLAVLAETGIVGFALFLLVLAAAFRSLLRSARLKDSDMGPLARTWLMVMVIMLLGGLTKHDHYDKLVWLTIGVGLSSMWQGNNLQNQMAK